MQKIFRPLIVNNPCVIGMIHVAALPGTPGYSGKMLPIISNAVAEAEIYLAAGIDMLAIENMHDVPYLNRNVGPEITAAMSNIGYEVKKSTGLPVGIQILAGANQSALAAACAAGLDFVRAEGFVFGHLADEGMMESDAGTLLRYRKQIGADHIAVITDIKKKHSSHILTSDISIEDTAKAADFFCSDGVIITGESTGRPASISELKTVRENVNIPVLVGSGINENNVVDYLPVCDGMIIGSWFKADGNWKNRVDPNRVSRLVKIVRDYRK